LWFRASVKNFVLIGLWPFVGSVFVFWVLGEFVATLGSTLPDDAI
jgi:hypothetical protein